MVHILHQRGLHHLQSYLHSFSLNWKDSWLFPTPHSQYGTNMQAEGHFLSPIWLLQLSLTILMQERPLQTFDLQETRTLQSLSFPFAQTIPLIKLRCLTSSFTEMGIPCKGGSKCCWLFEMDSCLSLSHLFASYMASSKHSSAERHSLLPIV